MNKLILSAVFLALFFGLFFSLNYLNPIDVKVNSIFYNPIYSSVFLPLTYLGDVEFLIFFSVCVVLFFIAAKKFKVAWFYSLTIILGLALHFFVRESLRVARPMSSRIDGFGFPSGHTFGAAICYWTIGILIWKKNKYFSSILFFIPFAVGFSRIYLGFHWLSDVIGSFILALSWIFLSLFFKEKFFIDKK